MIKPTVGRVVLYIPNSPRDGEIISGGDQPLAAIVVHVWNERMVNLTVFDANGNAHSRSSVLLVQPEDQDVPVGSYCQWMPYQIGQAAKTEKLEQELDNAVNNDHDGDGNPNPPVNTAVTEGEGQTDGTSPAGNEVTGD